MGSTFKCLGIIIVSLRVYTHTVHLSPNLGPRGGRTHHRYKTSNLTLLLVNVAGKQSVKERESKKKMLGGERKRKRHHTREREREREII